MRRFARPLGLVSAAGAVALAAALILAPPASAATAVPVTLNCEAHPPVGSPTQFTLDSTIQADGPASVAAGATFDVTLAPDALVVPTQTAGFNVNELKNLSLQIPVPANSTYQAATLSGGSNLGKGTPTVEEADNVVTVTVPGPLAGGSTVTLPVLHLTLVASGAAGTTIETHLAGTSYIDPGMRFTANVQVSFFTVDVPTSCFANPAPTFTSTTIEGAPPAE
jgi:dehydratase